MNRIRPVLVAAALLVAVGVVVAGIVFLYLTSQGISAKAEPGPVETFVAGTMRRLAVPRGDRDRKNPVEATPEVIADAMGHYADHCATCHANDGSGNTTIGKGLYPKAPDMRLRPTQGLTDGELFYIIENGVRLTGMPAWGDGTAERIHGSWGLVHFIRRLPSLTQADIEKMKGMNPRSPAEILEEEEMRRFLAGEDGAPKAEAKPKPKAAHGGHK